MNVTVFRPRFNRVLEPLSSAVARTGATPNQISLLSLLAGLASAYFFFEGIQVVGSCSLALSAVLDLVDGGVARKTGKTSDFGAVFDWIIDKYVDAIVILGAGLSGVAILTLLPGVPPLADFAVVALAITGSLMNTFIKPVVYAEIGFKERVEGKIDDPLEGVGFFGRPETILTLIAGGLLGLLGPAILLVAVCTNFSAIQRILYLYRTLS